MRPALPSILLPSLLLRCIALFFVSALAVNAAHARDGVFDAAIEIGQARMVKIFGASAGQVEGYSTGILVSGEGHILTIQGVYLDGANIRVVMADGETHDAAILKRDRETQLALLKIPVETPEFFELGKDHVGEKGDWAVALSNAFKVADKSEPLSVMLGVIALRTSIEARLNRRDVAYKGDLVLIDAITSNPGAGGGAVLLTDGRLVGMVGKIINSSETNTRLNYAVPSAVLADFLESDPADEEAVAADETTPADVGISIFQHGGRGGPAYIDRVKREGPADNAGLKPDDLIVTIGGEKVGSVREYEDVIGTLRPGEEVLFIVKRGVEIERIVVRPVEKE